MISVEQCKHLLARGGRCPSCGWEPEFKAPPNPPAFEAGTPNLVELKAEKCRRSLAYYVKEAWKRMPHLANTGLVWNWHHDALCLHLQTMAEEWAAARIRARELAEKLAAAGLESHQVAEWAKLQADIDKRAKQRIRNLLINIAPGTSKTLIVMVFFPTWMWTRWPDWSVRCVSSNPRAILESSDYARTLVESDWYQESFVKETWDVCDEEGSATGERGSAEKWEIRDDKQAKSDWGNTLGGFRRSTGLKAPVTGEHTDWLLCDDPHDAQQVHSEAERANVQSKWSNALFNRVNDANIACRVVVMQRLHPRDLSALILENQTGDWAHLVIASEFEPEHSKPTVIGWRDPRTERGQLLDPIRYPREVLDFEKSADRLGVAGYNAQHLQRPDAESGLMFPQIWWRFYRVDTDPRVDPETRPKGCRKDPPVIELKRDRWGKLDVDTVCVSVDATFGSTGESASNVGIIVGVVKAGTRCILADLTQGPRTFVQTLDDVEEAVKFAANESGLRSVRVIIEKKANGAAVLEMMEKALREGKFEGRDGQSIQVVFEAYEPGQNSKDSRAHAGTLDVEGGVLLVRDGARWLGKFIGEHASFGGTGRNDRVDATAQFLDKYRKKLTWRDAMRQAGK